jgi:hypothetical protein
VTSVCGSVVRTGGTGFAGTWTACLGWAADEAAVLPLNLPPGGKVLPLGCCETTDLDA